MAIAKVSAKGQITLPAKARKKVGIKPHSQVKIEVEGDSLVIRSTSDMFQYQGVLGPALPVAEERVQMQKAVTDHMEGLR